VLELDDPEDLAVELDVAAVLELVGGDHGAQTLAGMRDCETKDARLLEPGVVVDVCFLRRSGLGGRARGLRRRGRLTRPCQLILNATAIAEVA
jgi:hypothetical protein